MSNSVVMPQLGITMTEGTLSGWLKKPGDFVKKNEPLLTIETDKAEVEVESFVEGTLGKILVQPGQTVPVGTVLAYIEGNAEEQAVPATVEKPVADTRNEPVAAKSPVPESRTANTGRIEKSDDRRPVSPRAKRLAKELGIDFASLKGSGNNGEVLEEDIRRAAAKGQIAASSSSVPNLRRRQLIAERLTRSIQTIPTFSVATEANAEKLVALYESLRQPARSDGAKLTITDLLLTIFASALKSSADLTTTWENDRPKNNSSVDIGLAVATSEGVVAPVLKNLDSLDLTHLVPKRHELAEKARQGKLSLADLEGGVSTLSNLGMYRVDHFTALIAPGQSSILAVGKIRNRPWVESDKLTIKPTLILNLTVDHRIADGAAAATFLGKLVESIENPSKYNWQPASAQGNGTGKGRNA